MFGFFKSKKSDNSVEKQLSVFSVIPNEVAKVNVPEYDKNKVLATFLKMDGYSPNEINDIMNSRFPFDKAWKQYILPRKNYYDEMIRQLNQLKLLVIEGLVNNEQRGAFIVSCEEYLRLFVAKEVGISYPKCIKEEYYDLKGFCENLNSNDFEWIKKSLDKDIFNCIAFYSQRFNITYKELMSEFIQQIVNNANFSYVKYENIGGVDLYIDMISRLLELSFKSMKFSLKSIIPIEEIKEEVDTNSSNDFFDFNDMTSIYEGIQKIYIIKDNNMKIAENEIQKALDILDFLKKENKIPSNISYDTKNIVYAIQYKQYNNTYFNTFLRYTPLTSTGKIAKNMCTLNFDINEESCEFLNDGLYVVNDFGDDDKHRGLGGVIKYNKDKQITEIHMFFHKDKISYDIKTKTDKIKSIDDIDLTIEKADW